MIDFNSGILGLNARNLLYIKPFNDRKNFVFADDKLKTKHFLAARGVSVPRLYGVIRNKSELQKFDFSSLPNKFVLKPNLGSGGEGIIPFVKTDHTHWHTISGKKMTLDEVKQHIVDIIDGRFSITGGMDSAFFEQLIITHDGLKPYTYRGLPDIRVIVFNMIPVMAMLRLPTKESDGKANLRQGAVGIGLDLAKGQTTYICHHGKVVNEIPDVGPIKIQLPYWEKILEIAIKSQVVTNLGFLAADISIDQTVGPVLLEINARAGLQLQVANQAGLRKRLERVKGLKVKTPQQGIRIAKDMFGNVTERTITNISGKTIIGNEEQIEVLITPAFKIPAIISTSQSSTTVNEAFMAKLGKKPPEKLKFILANKRITTIYKLNPEQESEIVIGRRALQDFLIDPNKVSTAAAPKTLPDFKTNKSFYVSKVNYYESDKTLVKIDRQVKLVSRLNPLNLAEELGKFREDPFYNPQFVYQQPNLDFPKMYELLTNIQTDETALGELFEGKKAELKLRLDLISRIGSQEFDEYSTLNFPQPTQAQFESALQIIKKRLNTVDPPEQDISAEKAAEMFQETLNEYNLTDWKVELTKNTSGRCSVSKFGKIFIRQDAVFSQARVKRLIAHEIETHILTNENGSRQPYQIFKIGTANYLSTQEGLAMYNELYASEKAGFNYQFLSGAGGVLASHFASQLSFSETYNNLIDLGYPTQRALALTLKAKRGFEDTKQKGSFNKSAIYYIGYEEIMEYLKQGGDITDLYIGKINIHQIPLIKKIKNILPPFYLPKFYAKPTTESKKSK